jgi:hypothetical protein
MTEAAPGRANIARGRPARAASSTRRRFSSWLMASLILAGASSGCGNDRSVSASIAALVATGAGSRLVLAEHARFPWDRVCVVGPYTGDDQVDSLIGIPGAAAQAHGIRSNDGINVLMFVAQGRVAASIAHRRDQGDFAADVVGRCYSRSQAVFSIRAPSSGGRRIIAPE